MGIAIDTLIKPPGVVGDLRGAIERTGGEIQIGHALFVQASEFIGAQGREIDG